MCWEACSYSHITWKSHFSIQKIMVKVVFRLLTAKELTLIGIRMRIPVNKMSFRGRVLSVHLRVHRLVILAVKQINALRKVVDKLFSTRPYPRHSLYHSSRKSLSYWRTLIQYALTLAKVGYKYTSGGSKSKGKIRSNKRSSNRMHSNLVSFLKSIALYASIKSRR